MESCDISLKEVSSSLPSDKALDRLNNCSNTGIRTCNGLVEPANYHTDTGRFREGNEFQTVTVSSGHGCVHKIVHRIGERLRPLMPIPTPARDYPFKLDPFQEQAILCIENERSVLVSAHTSAGKTVVAEYAVARSLRANRRVIYTTPIKALSNQKFKEFADEFTDVGLMTGDVTVNPEATVLVMTTEVLRLMLYRGFDITRKVGWVIFDEVHYLRDKERGVVWEETIILLPDNVGLVFLSATIPNAIQFAEWIVSLHHRPCHVVNTDIRPVPLEHYVFPCGGDGIHLVVNQKCEFLEANFNAALNVLRTCTSKSATNSKMLGRRPGYMCTQPYCADLVKILMNQNLGPLIIFSFSRDECENLFTSMNGFNLNTAEESAKVDSVFNNAISNLSDEDKQLPQFQRLLPSLRRGIGTHHSGLLPILREIVEILFSNGFIKILYATETFAMGLNMPARTVVFTNTRKFDGRVFRTISTGEYVQMSGRAGRRGKDDRGAVIIMLDSSASPYETKQLLLSQPERLNSSFFTTNNMVLNFLQMKNTSPEMLLEKSFYQFQTRWLEKRIRMLEEEARASQLPPEVELDQLRSCIELRKALASAQREQWSLVMKANCIASFLKPGRVVHVRALNDTDYGWGVVINFNQIHTQNSDKLAESTEGSTVMVECLLQVCSMIPFHNINHLDSHKDDRPIPLAMVEPIIPNFKISENDSLHSKVNAIRLISVPISCLAGLSSVCLPVSNILGHPGKGAPQPDCVLRCIWEELDQAKKKHSGCFPLLDPVEDMRIDDERLANYKETILMLELQLALQPLMSRSDIDHLLNLHIRRPMVLRDLDIFRTRLKNRNTLFHSNELYIRKHLLRTLGFLSHDDVVTFKGQIACTILSGDDLLLTELILDGLFSPLTPVQLASVMSCFVSGRSPVRKPIAPLGTDFEQALNAIHTKARFLARAATESRLRYLQSDENENLNTSLSGAPPNHCTDMLDNEQVYVRRFTGGLMEVVRAWAEGVSFARLCELTSAFEGALIRCMRRLDQLLREMYDAAKKAGDSELEKKSLEALDLIRRDIVFASSLYL
ncbi:unnamed protein product [Dicrocoelium dendriticum]|nr:unnamed protein product [Dicrocoelium dendriticum]